MIKTTDVDLKNLWTQLGIQKGMLIYCHSFIAALGQIIPDPEIIIDTLIEHLGDSGTLIIPTFSMSHFKDEIYNVEESDSVIGALGNIIRKRPDAIRSLDPNFSMVAIGKDAQLLMKRESLFSFGLGSIYEKILSMNPHVLLLGVDYTGLSLFMHLEKIAAVNYRYDKIFTGISKNGDEKYEDSSIHFVRDLAVDPISDRNRIGAIIDEEEDCKKVSYAYATHRLIPSRTITKIVAQNLTKDPYCLIKINGSKNIKRESKSLF
jgi:aminoglycoside 3-N-acetyltransferase